MEIAEGNKLIAEFEYGTTDWTAMAREHCIFETELHYHSSWDWLMPVIDKIETIKLTSSIVTVGVNIYKDTCKIKSGKWNDVYIADVYDGNHGDEYTKLSATYEAVVVFIKWYNENKDGK